MYVSLILTADYANTTADGKLNVMGIFSTLRTNKFPAAHPEMYLVAQLLAGPAEYGRNYEFRIKLLDEDATREIVNIAMPRVVPKGTNGKEVRQDVIVRLNHLVFPRAGTYEFSLLIDNDVKATKAIEVEQVKLPTPTPPAPESPPE